MANTEQRDASRHDPFLRIVKRNSLHWWQNLLIRLAAVILAMAVCAMVIYGIVHLNPLLVYGSIWNGAFGTVTRTWITIKETAFLLCIAVGLAEYWRGRTNPDGRRCHSSLHDLPEPYAQPAASAGNADSQHPRRIDLGSDPGVFQGQI